MHIKKQFEKNDEIQSQKRYSDKKRVLFIIKINN